MPRYDFNWKSTYRLVTPIKVPAGTKIECTGTFDNSADNPNNPDPTKEVRWGDQTWEAGRGGKGEPLTVVFPKIAGRTR